MLPRAPKAGKRILLGASPAVAAAAPSAGRSPAATCCATKKRFWMTVIGVAGCTSLLVAGFGISDSLNSIITKQYGDIYHYDLLTIVANREATRAAPSTITAL